MTSTAAEPPPPLIALRAGFWIGGVAAGAFLLGRWSAKGGGVAAGLKGVSSVSENTEYLAACRELPGIDISTATPAFLLLPPARFRWAAFSLLSRRPLLRSAQKRWTFTSEKLATEDRGALALWTR
eukprot:SAG22_NODE_58_length_23645_cov_16.637943_19_plen_126_part_00